MGALGGGADDDDVTQALGAGSQVCTLCKIHVFTY